MGLLATRSWLTLATAHVRSIMMVVAMVVSGHVQILRRLPF